MPVLGAATLELNADSGKLEQDLGRAAHVAEKELKRVEAMAAAAGAAIAAMAVAAAYSLGQTVRETINTADQMGKLSQRTGIAVETLSQMKYAADLADVSMDQLSTSLTKFNLELVEAHDKTSKAGRLFTAMGVDITAGPHQAMLQFADSVRGLSSVQAQVAVVREAFGRASPELLNFILNLREGSEEARRMGLTMSGKLAKDANEFNDNLKRLQASSSALGISIANHLLPHLVTMSSRFLEAKQNGNLLVETLRTYANVLQYSVFPAHNLVGRGIGAMLPGQSIVGRAPQFSDLPLATDPVAGSGPNQDEVMCVASGGRWVGGKCIPKGAKNPKDRTSEYLRDAKQIEEGEQEFIKDQREAQEIYFKYRRNLLEDHQHHVELVETENGDHIVSVQERVSHNAERAAEIEKQRIQVLMDAEDERQEREIEQGKQLLNSLNSSEKATASAARELGMTFSSAFEDAIVKGRELSDVLRGLAQDIQMMLVRQLITKPIADQVMGAVSSGGIGEFFGSLFGPSGGGEAAAFAGGITPMARGGRASAGRPYWVGDGGEPELFVPEVSGTIVPMSSMGGGGPSVFIDARGADAAALARLERTVERMDGSFERRAIAANVDAARRGLRA